MEKELKLWHFKLDDSLEKGEEFKGLVQLSYDNDEGIGLIGIAEKWDAASAPESRRYVNVKMYQKSIYYNKLINKDK